METWPSCQDVCTTDTRPKALNAECKLWTTFHHVSGGCWLGGLHGPQCAPLLPVHLLLVWNPPPRPLSTPLLLLLAGSAAALQSGQLSRQDQSQQILEFNNEGLRHVRLQLFFSFFPPRCPLVTNGSCVDAMCSRHWLLMNSMWRLGIYLTRVQYYYSFCIIISSL